MTRITVACLDMAGTTVRDDGTVMEAFTSAIATQNLTVKAFQAAMRDVRSTMGQSKIEVFRRILGDEEAAQRANKTFEDHYATAVAAGGVEPMPGAVDTITALREAGVRVCLATGFSPATRDAIIDKLGWARSPACSPMSSGDGRPGRRDPARFMTWSPELRLRCAQRRTSAPVGKQSVITRG
ncbi:MAG: HAD family hydrolase [Streptosporangiaceae bacterium]